MTYQECVDAALREVHAYNGKAAMFYAELAKAAALKEIADNLKGVHVATHPADPVGEADGDSNK